MHMTNLNFKKCIFGMKSKPRRQTMKKKSVGFGMIGILFMAALLGALSQSGEDLFQRALRLERNEGKLMEAVELYNRVVAEKGNEGLAAKAQLRIGLCYEKLGQKSVKLAQDAFQKVIDNYPSQSEEVRIARDKLSGIQKARDISDRVPDDLRISKVWSGREVFMSGGWISPDGKYLSFTDWDTGDLAILELAIGKSRRLTNKGSWLKSQEFALISKWSPDGKQVVYSWYNPESHKFDIRSVDLKGQEPRILSSEFGYVEPFDWHPDGKRILIFFGKESKFKIGYLSVVDGNLQILKTFKQKNTNLNYSPWDFVISPDGSSIAYDYFSDQTSNNRDIFLLSSDGTHEERLISHPALDIVFDWTSDGQYLLFGSERTGVRGVWIVPVKGGKANGAPSLVKPNIGPAYSLGCTIQNQFFYGYSGDSPDVYVAEIDPASGQVLVPPKIEIRNYEGHNSFPDYSPDGKYLAYSSSRTTLPNSKKSICIYSLENGEIRELNQGSFNLDYPQWRPDGKAIAWRGTDSNGQEGIYEMDVLSEKISPLIRIEENEQIYSHRWGIDGQILFYTKGFPSKRKCWIFTTDLKTGLNEKLQGSPDDAGDFDVSPDGRSLVFLNRAQKRSLRIIPTSGGEFQELHNFEVMGERSITPAWSINGKSIFFYSSTSLNEMDLWMYSLEERKVQKINIQMANFRHLSVHPDGRHITFSSFGATLSDEVWVMENFLPKTKDKK